MSKKIEDFGQKIGGARKDWNLFLSVDKLQDMNEAEKIKYTTRDHVWPLPNAKKIVADGGDPFVAYWQRAVRRKVNSKPVIRDNDDIDETLKNYINVVSEIRDKVMSMTSEQDIMDDFYPWVYEHTTGVGYRRYLCEDWRPFVSYRIGSLRYNHASMKQTIARTGFPNSTTASGEKKKPRKRAFIPPQLTNIEREGKDYRHGRNIDARIWQDQFNFRGVEFGNWMTQKDRRFSMNYAYDALLDLSNILRIDEKDIAFGGRLALAFGARGTSRASAHYEPLREVINLTKMRGAGCTAHEWMHALDDYIGKKCNCKGMASNLERTADLPTSFVKLVKALKYDQNGNKTNYLISSEKFNESFAKEPHGYWNSNCEMLARAFACYVKDSLGCKSDYLIAHADSYVFEFDDESEVCAIPQGEEREIFNQLFDKVFFDLKKMGLLHKKVPKPVEKISAVLKTASMSKLKLKIEEESSGQLFLAI